MFRYIKKKFVTEGSNRTKSQLTATPCPPPPPHHLKLPYIMIFLIMANQSKKCLRNTPEEYDGSLKLDKTPSNASYQIFIA